MRTVTKNVVNTCDTCQLVKSSNVNNKGITKSIVSKYVGHKVFVDCFGPLVKGAQGFTYVVVFLDGFSKFVKFYPLRKATSKSILSQLKKYIHEMGFTPNMIVFDNASQFVSKVWEKGLNDLNIKPGRISIYNPRSNLAERCLKELGVILRCFLLNKPHNQWVKYLTEAERIINTNLHSIIGFKPCEVVSCRRYLDEIYKAVRFPDNEEEYKLDSSELQELVAKRMKKYADRMRKISQKSCSKIKYKVGDIVLTKNVILSNKSKKISKKLAPKYKGYYKIVEIRGNCFKVQHVKSNKIISVNRNFVKLYNQ